jgi:hypothetical protein
MAVYIKKTSCTYGCQDPPCGCPIPTVTSSSFAPGNACAAFSYTITASNSPTSYSATGLPAWATLNTTTGAITGTPSVESSTNITVKATNACGDSAGFAVNISISAPCSLSVGIYDSFIDSEHEIPNICSDLSWDVTDMFPCETNLKIEWRVEHGSASFQVLANGGEVLQTFCDAQSTPSVLQMLVFSVPANTNTIRVKVTCLCAEDTNILTQFGYSITCEYPPP